MSLNNDNPSESQPELDRLSGLLVSMGCPAGKSREMASQLDKRAKQLALKKGRSYQEAMEHLLVLMKQGWAARDRGR